MLSPDFNTQIANASKVSDLDTLKNILAPIDSKLELLVPDKRANVRSSLLQASIINDLKYATYLVENKPEEALELLEAIDYELVKVLHIFHNVIDKKLNLVADELEKIALSKDVSNYIADTLQDSSKRIGVKPEKLLFSLVKESIELDAESRESELDSSVLEATKERLESLIEQFRSYDDEDFNTILTALKIKLDAIDELGGESSFSDDQLVNLFASTFNQKLDDFEHRQFSDLSDNNLESINEWIEELGQIEEFKGQIFKQIVDTQNESVILRIQQQVLSDVEGKCFIRITASDPKDPDMLRYKLDEFPFNLVDESGAEYKGEIRGDGALRFDMLPSNRTYSFKLKT